MAKNNGKKKNASTKNKSVAPSKLDMRILYVMIASLIIAFVLGYLLAGAVMGGLFTIILLVFLFIARFLDSTSSKKRRRKLINALFIGVLILLIVGTLGVVGFFTYVVLEAPAFDVNKLVNKESSILYDSEGVEIG